LNGQLQRVVIPPALRGFASTAPAAQAFEVSWQEGRITHIVPVPGAPEGTLVSAPVDVHVHIDKSYTVDEVGEARGDLGTAIARMKACRAGWTAEQVRSRMTRALEDAWRCGTRALRTHIDWPDPLPPLSLSVLLELRETWRNRVELQFVSLTPLDAFDAEGAAWERARLLSELGGVLGTYAYRNADLEPKLRRAFALAAENGLALDLHVDEGLHADATALACAAGLTLEYGLQGRVTCGHACSLSMQPGSEAQRTLERCADAGVHLVALPTTNLYLQGQWGATPVERGITRLREAREAGVNVCIATDNVADAFYPYGSYDLIETFGLGVQVAHLPDPADWLGTITTAPARAMSLEWDGAFRVGGPADFIVLQARTGFELVTPLGRGRRVYRRGAAC
jgi:cytosine/creatinine deaminase